ncbi:hypothetical protein R1sor_017677 [Riccia sorocarpa]|uniref:Transmembrane protein n=1 Tax=Riccia sorocarpa TaxID=122646 RepID=A0ABD3IB35_9MARC
MQRVNSGVFTNIVPSAQKPPRAPTSKPTRSTEMDALRFRDVGFGEKHEKRRWKLRSDQAVHLVPIVLLVCLFILYICSSLQVEDGAIGHDHSAKTGALHRRLLEGSAAVEEASNLPSTVTRGVRVKEHDFHRFPLRLRGGNRRP